jgi:hypothetical protein
MHYLTQIKNEIGELVDGLQHEVETMEEPSELPQMMAAWSKELWKLIEQSLKKSYRNGLRAGGDNPKAAAEGNGGKKAYNFRRKKEVES